MTQPEPEDSCSKQQPLDEYHNVHSNIFDDLVNNDVDLVGFIAYGIYQTRKREWIIDYKKAHNCLPDEEAKRNFTFSLRAGAREDLLSTAEGYLLGYADEVMKNETDNMKATALSEKVASELSNLSSTMISEFGKLKEISSKNGSYKHHIVGHVIGFIVLVSIVSFVYHLLPYEPSVNEIVRAPVTKN